MIKEKIIIVGAGPAGIACSIQLKRFGYNPLVIEKKIIGGLAVNANKIENYCGYYNGISGIELVDSFKKHFFKHKVRINYEEVNNVEHKSGKFNVKTYDNEYLCDYLVVASGSIPKKLDFHHKKIFYEVSELKAVNNCINKCIAIVGSGDAAFDYALNLSEKNNKILILNRGDKTKSLNLLKDQALIDQNISYLENSKIIELIDIGNNLSLKCLNTNNKAFDLKCDYILGAIGRIANDTFLSENLLNTVELSNFFKIGDVVNGDFRQISISTGDGVKAAMQIHNEIMGE